MATAQADFGEELPAHYAAGDVFAMPCRTRWLGLDLEALGVVFLEAAATGLPVVAGRRRVEAEFAWKAVAARLEQLLAEAAAGGPGGPGSASEGAAR